MRILYILECMLMIILDDGTRGGLVLISTKEPMTSVDFFIGFFAWIILAFLIFGIMFFVKYSRNKVLLKKEEKTRKLIIKSKKYLLKKTLKTGLFFWEYLYLS